MASTLQYPEPPCPFCVIASKYPPRSALSAAPTDQEQATQAGDGTGLAHLVLSTKHVLAFLDIMPLTRGHVLVVPRKHCKTLGDVDSQLGMEVIQLVYVLLALYQA